MMAITVSIGQEVFPKSVGQTTGHHHLARENFHFKGV